MTRDVRAIIKSGERIVVVFEVGGERRRFNTQLSASNMEGFRESFYRELETVWQILGDRVKSNLQVLAEAMRRLYDLGIRLNYELFGRDRYRFEDYMKSVVPNWRLSGSSSYVPPILTIQAAPHNLIPLEFLPVFDTTPPAQLDTIGALTQFAARFPAFSMITQRTLDDPAIPERSPVYIENLPRLNIGFFRHAGLRAVADEETFFASSPEINLRGPWPATDLPLYDFKSELADRVWNPSPKGGAPDHVQHFACHCNTTDASSDNYALLLAHARTWWSSDWHAKPATIADFERFFGSAPQRSDSAPHPLIFLSACGSSRITARGVTSFPALFLRIGSRGVIGTETRIPDRFAAAFTRHFYNHFLRAYPLGECIYRARWRMLLDQHNPLGILYTAYADARLRVRRPASGAEACPREISVSSKTEQL
jgi:hypothetical protein